jgi:hypothetical protein
MLEIHAHGLLQANVDRVGFAGGVTLLDVQAIGAEILHDHLGDVPFVLREIGHDSRRLALHDHLQYRLRLRPLEHDDLTHNNLPTPAIARLWRKCRGVPQRKASSSLQPQTPSPSSPVLRPEGPTATGPDKA